MLLILNYTIGALRKYLGFLTNVQVLCDLEFDNPHIIRGDQIGLFKLVTLNCILNCITGVTFGC
jgi:hypothetical protein